MHSKLWFQVQEGNTTQLTYMPDDPDETQPGSRFVWQVRGWVGILMMVFGALGIAIISTGAFQEWLQVRQTF